MKVRNHKGRNKIRMQKDTKEALFTGLGILSMLVGIYIVIPVLIPLLKLTFAIILIVGGYFIVSRNSKLFYFRRI